MKPLLDDARIFSTLILISLFIFLFDSLNLFRLPKSLLQNLTSPIQYGVYRTGQSMRSQFQFLIMARRSARENVALKEQLASLLLENSKLRTKLFQTQALVEQQEALNPVNFKTISASPIGLTRYLLIDKGSDDGIKIDQSVVFKDSLLGLIKEVSPKKSSIMLLFDPDSKIASVVTGPNSKAQGVLIGQFGSQLLLDKVLHQESLQIGDIVYSQGSQGKLPRGLILGTITEVLEKDNEVFKQAKVKPIFEVSTLDTVFVIVD